MKTTRIEITAVLEVDDIDANWGGVGDLTDNLPDDGNVRMVTFRGNQYHYVGKLRVTRAKEVKP
jgi:hypothetical protein